METSKLRLAFLYLGAGVLASGVLTPAGPVRADTESGKRPVTASYEVYFGGFHVLNAQARMENGGETYRISAEAETQGMLSWFFDWKGATESQGYVAADRVIPQQHDNHGVSDAGERKVRLR